MSEQEIEKHIKFLDDVLYEYNTGESKKSYAKNAKSRDEADRIMDTSRGRAKSYIDIHTDLYLFLVGDKGNNTDKAFFIDDFYHFRYFGNNLHKFLARLREEKQKTA